MLNTNQFVQIDPWGEIYDPKPCMKNRTISVYYGRIFFELFTCVFFSLFSPLWVQTYTLKLLITLYFKDFYKVES